MLDKSGNAVECQSYGSWPTPKIRQRTVLLYLGPASVCGRFQVLMRIFLGDKRFQKSQCRLKVYIWGSQKTLIWLKPFASYNGLLAPKKWANFFS